MSVFDKLRFWKKEPALPSLDLNAGMPGMPDMNMDMGHMPGMEPNPENDLMNKYSTPEPSVPAMQQPSYGQYPQQQQNIEKDIQIISLKLDAIKSELDSMNMRIMKIEQIADGEQQQSTAKKSSRQWY